MYEKQGKINKINLSCYDFRKSEIQAGKMELLIKKMCRGHVFGHHFGTLRWL